jgi:hypothetical protein
MGLTPFSLLPASQITQLTLFLSVFAIPHALDFPVDDRVKPFHGAGTRERHRKREREEEKKKNSQQWPAQGALSPLIRKGRNAQTLPYRFDCSNLSDAQLIQIKGF